MSVYMQEVVQNYNYCENYRRH